MDTVTVSLSPDEKWELQRIVTPATHHHESNPLSSRNQPELFKEDLLSYVRSSQKSLEDKNKAIEWMKDFFIEQKCYPRRGRNDP